MASTSTMRCSAPRCSPSGTRKASQGRRVSRSPTTRCPKGRTQLSCNAMFSWIKPKVAEAETSTGFNEQPLFGPKETMRLGELEVSPMGLGTWSWGNKLLWDYNESMDPELQELFNYCVSKGINLFDTADSYGTGPIDGRSETLLGRFMKEYPGSEAVRSKINIATKYAAYPWRILPGNVVAACKGSLARLGVEKVALGQLHWSTAKYQPLQELALWNGLADCYDRKLISAVGVSNYGPKELERVHGDFAKRGIPLASAQIQYSLLSCGPEQREALTFCKQKGIGLIAYSPLALGLLTGKYTEDKLPKGPRGVLFKQLLPEIKPLLDVMREVAKGRKKTMSQVAINWCMMKGTVPIPGAKDLVQAKENLGALGWRLYPSEVEALDQAAGKLKKGMIQNIFQTN